MGTMWAVYKTRKMRCSFPSFSVLPQMMGITIRADKKKKKEPNRKNSDIIPDLAALPINPIEIAVVYGSH